MAFWTMFALSCDRPAYAADDLPAPQTDLARATEAGATRTAVFAGGCFWCTEAVFQQIPGVQKVISGYSGGTKESATYEQVSNGDTGHAEAIQIVYDPSKVTFGQLMRVFFATHDPTTKDRQGPDHGHQYRSAIFYQNEDERKAADAYIQQLSAAKAFSAPIITTLEPFVAFYPAEDYHQDFADKNPFNPYIQRFAAPKAEKARTKLAPQISGTTMPTTAPSDR